MRWFRIPSYRPPDEQPSRGASNWLLATVLCAVAPHAVRLPLWLTLTVVLSVVWRFGIDNHAWRAPAKWLQWLLLAAVTLGILKTFGTFLGRDAGVAFLTAATGLKVLEIRNLRDYLVTVFLAYFLVLGAFLYSQTMLIAAYGLMIVMLTTASLAHLNNPQGFSGTQAWRLIGRIVMFGLPICLVLYLFFPRIQGSLWGLPEDAFASSTGMTDEVRPGTISRLSTDTTTAFRVEFEGETPEPRDRYWRVYVLSVNEGGGWDRREIMTAFDGALPGGFEGQGPAMDYTVTLEPHNERWLPVLDLPVTVPDIGHGRNGFLVGTRHPVNRLTRYSMTSRRVASTGPLNLLEKKTTLEMETGPSARVASLLDPWQDLAPEARVDAALRYFREEPFRYTLTPPRLGADPFDEFLFETRAGYCEHYASTFVAMMRWSGVPARLIVGYQGGGWNEAGGYLTVSQSDAHAWAEVWLPGQGWTRADPTAAIAPERIELGAEAIRLLLEQGGVPGQLSNSEVRRLIARSWLQRQLLRTQWAWDNLNYVWNTWVMGYGPEVQREFLRWIGFQTPTWGRMIATLAAGVGILLLIAGLWIARPATREDPLVRLYRRALSKLARSGLTKSPTEGPRAFQRRLEREAPEVARRLKPVTEMYIALRYADDTRYDAGTFRALVARL